MQPILFTTEMVRAILDGRKTVTRRAIRPQPEGRPVPMSRNSCWPGYFAIEGTPKVTQPPCQTRDVLWVRETWQHIPCIDCRQYESGCVDKPVTYESWEAVSEGCFIYRADYPEPQRVCWRPSIHMPKEAARLFLRVTGVRVERLWDIIDDQCEAEGVVGWTKDGKLYKYAPADSEGDGPAWKWQDCPKTPKEAMRRAWNATIKPANLPLYGWEANPWVWVIEFERISEEETT